MRLDRRLAYWLWSFVRPTPNSGMRWRRQKLNSPPKFWLSKMPSKPVAWPFCALPSPDWYRPLMRNRASRVAVLRVAVARLVQAAHAEPRPVAVVGHFQRGELAADVRRLAGDRVAAVAAEHPVERVRHVE